MTFSVVTLTTLPPAVGRGVDRSSEGGGFVAGGFFFAGKSDLGMVPHGRPVVVIHVFKKLVDPLQHHGAHGLLGRPGLAAVLLAQGDDLFTAEDSTQMAQEHEQRRRRTELLAQRRTAQVDARDLRVETGCADGRVHMDDRT